MSLQAVCGDASVDDHIRKVTCSAHNVGIQRFYYFACLLFHSVYEYVCGAVRQSKALSILGQVVLHRIKRSSCMWIPDAERLKMSAVEVVSCREGHLAMRRPSTASALCVMMLCGRRMRRSSSASLNEGKIR